jgi:hypothetical protein
MTTDDLPDVRAPGTAADEDALLEQAMQEVPRGALAVSLVAVALLMIGWFLLYFAVFLPRGSVG